MKIQERLIILYFIIALILLCTSAFGDVIIDHETNKKFKSKSMPSASLIQSNLNMMNNSGTYAKVIKVYDLIIKDEYTAEVITSGGSYDHKFYVQQTVSGFWVLKVIRGGDKTITWFVVNE